MTSPSRREIRIDTNHTREAANTIPEIYFKEPVRRLSEIWPHEAHDFTPWLVENLDQLAATLDLNLEDEVETEKTLPNAGRIDIYALEKDTGAGVVIENQLGLSDHSHWARLLGYVIDSEASILIWVARDFTSYHQSLLNWLNQKTSIDAYAVAIQASRVGGALGIGFQVVVGPEEEPRTIKRTLHTIGAEFYRPVVEQLKQEGMRTRGRNTWTGRYRSFQAGLEDSLYGTRIENGLAQVFLRLSGERRHERFKALQQYKEEINGKIKGSVSWAEDGELWDVKDKCYILLENKEPFRLTDPQEGWDCKQKWVTKSLLSLWKALEPCLNKLRQEEEALSDA